MIRCILGGVVLFVWAAVGRADVPAPGGLLPVQIDADLTQVVTDRSGTYLVARLSLTNRSVKPLELSADAIRLHVGEAMVRHARPERDDVDVAIIDANNERTSKRVAQLSWFSPGRLAVGEKLTAWCAFNLSGLPYFTDDPALWDRARWRIIVDTPRGTASLDLKQHERRVLAVRSRPSRFDERVTVIEIGPRVNSLNVDVLADAVAHELARQPGFIAIFSHGTCLIDEHMTARIRDLDLGRWPVRRQVVVVDEKEHSGLGHELGFYDSATLELAATVMVLGPRPDATPALLEFVRHDSLDVRLAAVKALGDWPSDCGKRVRRSKPPCWPPPMMLKRQFGTPPCAPCNGFRASASSGFCAKCWK